MAAPVAPSYQNVHAFYHAEVVYNKQNTLGASPVMFQDHSEVETTTWCLLHMMQL